MNLLSIEECHVSPGQSEAFLLGNDRRKSLLLSLSANPSQQKENHGGKVRPCSETGTPQGQAQTQFKENTFFPPALNHLYPLETVQALDGKWLQKKLQAAKCNYISTREPTKWGESNFKIGLALLKQF